MSTSRVPSDRPVSETVVEVRMPELDSFGHVNHAVFLNYFEHARFGALAQAGFDWGVLAERHWGIFVVRIEVDYVSEATRGDSLLIRTWADRFRRTTMELEQEMVRAGDPDVIVARARVFAVWIGPDRRPMRLPEDVKAGLMGEAADDPAGRRNVGLPARGG